MPDHCPPREALQRVLIQRAESYEAEGKLLRKIARQIGAASLDGDVAIRLWAAISEVTPGMERPGR